LVAILSLQFIVLFILMYNEKLNHIKWLLQKKNKKRQGTCCEEQHGKRGEAT
jgi:hypothetical protein